jgi:hypothetical protein
MTNSADRHRTQHRPATCRRWPIGGVTTATTVAGAMGTGKSVSASRKAPQLILRASPAVNLPSRAHSVGPWGIFLALQDALALAERQSEPIEISFIQLRTKSMSIRLSQKAASCRSRPRAWSQAATSMTSSEGCATNHARHGVRRSKQNSSPQSTKKFHSSALLQTSRSICPVYPVAAG